MTEKLHRTIAIPAFLTRQDLHPDVRNMMDEMAHVPLTVKEIADRQAEEAEHEKAHKKAQHIAFKKEIKTLLDKKDIVSIRCFEDGIKFPNEWKIYSDKLRELFQAGEGVIPDAPVYPLPPDKE